MDLGSRGNADVLSQFEQIRDRGCIIKLILNPLGGDGLAYMNTDKTGGVIMEIAQLPSDFDPAKGVQYLSSWDEKDET